MTLFEERANNGYLTPLKLTLGRRGGCVLALVIPWFASGVVDLARKASRRVQPRGGGRGLVSGGGVRVPRLPRGDGPQQRAGLLQEVL